MNFDGFFEQATGIDQGPYDYQRRLAEGAWPDLLEIPTGLGKTAAVVLAWLYKRRNQDPDTPRRLVYCLPMRVLVEQTVSNIERWLRAHDLYGEPGEGKVSVNVLMGGAPDLRKAEWADHPEEDTILVGTQDMLLSRALMRGYGMSRYQWPVHFALLHNDALWVYDEVQLMGAALPTSTQLEGLRRHWSTGRSCRSLWISATLHKDWLQTVDFREHIEALDTATLTDRDRDDANVKKRVNAPKGLAPAGTRLDADNNKQKAAAYIESLAGEIAEAHQAGRQTLVILNRVERAQALYAALREKLPAVDHLLLHARFRPRERREIERRLQDEPDENGRVIVATQAIEAGVDISSHTLFTELAPWSSMVQRFGRCNRAGEHTDARIRWIDIDGEADEALPYEPDTLVAARERLTGLRSANAEALPKVDQSIPRSHVLRRRDLLDLFNTDPDLSGFDVDVSPYIRDPGNAQSQVFWREFDERPSNDAAPAGGDELCPVGLGQLKDYLGKKGRDAWAWDPLGERWRPIDKNQMRPGQVLLLRAGAGGYLEDRGFVADAKQAVTPVESGNTGSQDRYSDDTWIAIGRYVTLTEHLQDVAGEAQALAGRLDLDDAQRNILTEAGRWHDVGKAHEAFQRGICGDDEYDKNTQWAKTKRKGFPDYHIVDDNGERQKRKGFRHELASMLAWLEHGHKNEHADIIAYLIAAHHGKVRMGLRALPTEEPPDDETLYARGVWHGDRLPSVALNGKTVPETELRLDLMRLGEGPQGASWTERTQRLLQTYGPFRLAWLEALVRVADWRASRKEQEAGNEA